MSPTIRQLLLDVIILDSESADAPSLADMAKRARALLVRELRGKRHPAPTLERVHRKLARAIEDRALFHAPAPTKGTPTKGEARRDE